MTAVFVNKEHPTPVVPEALWAIPEIKTQFLEISTLQWLYNDASAERDVKMEGCSEIPIGLRINGNNIRFDSYLEVKNYCCKDYWFHHHPISM